MNYYKYYLVNVSRIRRITNFYNYSSTNYAHYNSLFCILLNFNNRIIKCLINLTILMQSLNEKYENFIIIHFFIHVISAIIIKLNN